MHDQTVTEETAQLALDKGFNVEEPCTCGGYPDCICEQARAQSKRIYCPTQTTLQSWIREVSGINAYALPTHVVESTRSFVRYQAKMLVLREETYLVDNRVGMLYDTYEEALEAALLKTLKKMKPVETVIDLSRYRNNDANKSTTGRVFSGREFGSLVRSECGIDRFARLRIPVTIQLPDDTFTVNPTFIEELIQGAVYHLGPAEFKRLFTFSCKSGFNIKDNLELSIERLYRHLPDSLKPL